MKVLPLFIMLVPTVCFAAITVAIALVFTLAKESRVADVVERACSQQGGIAVLDTNRQPVCIQAKEILHAR